MGPHDSLDHIMLFGRDDKDIEMISFPYEQTEDTIRIIKENDHIVDQWLFSGQAPYHYARTHGVLPEGKGSYPPLHGSSFFATLLESIVAEGKILRRFSIDTIAESEIAASKELYSLQALQFFSYPYTGYLPSEKLIAFHQDLYDKGEIDVAITCLKSVYNQLKALGIPCYRVKPSNISIQIVLNLLKERGLSVKYQKSQLAVFGVEMIHDTKTKANDHFSYREKHRKLELTRVLLDFAEDIKGSFVQIGDNLFFIYTTRGELSLHLNEKGIHSLIERIKIQSELAVKVALGYGLTVLDAEQNLRFAFQHARRQPEEIFVIVNEDREVTEQKPNEGAITFSPRKWGEGWEERFKDASISPAVVSKIEALANHYKKIFVTSTDIATWLKSSERNGRRVLAELEKLGLVAITGEEQSGHRGRPRKIYKLLFI